MLNLITHAAAIARRIHKGQFRKYTERPYVEHCARVAALVSLQPTGCTDRSIAAAWLHDTIEDCRPEEKDELIAELHRMDNAYPNINLWMLVDALTNLSKQFPHLNREERKKMDRERLSKASDEVKIIKLCDRYDNLCELPAGDFRVQYGYESVLLVDAIGHANPTMAEAILDQIERPPGLPRILLPHKFAWNDV